jgi:hypothetical protein
MRTIAPHAHVWIDPTEASIERAPYSPVIGPLRHEMKLDREYLCLECGLKIWPREMLAKVGFRTDGWVQTK